MIKIVHRNQIDSGVWDNFIERSLQRNIYALSWYLDLMPKRWGAVIEFDKSLNYVTVLPFQLKSVYGIDIVDQEPATKELGFYSLTEDVSEELLTMLKNKFRYISRYNFNAKNDLGYLSGLESRTTYHLNLNCTYDTLFTNYKSMRKRTLKKAKERIQHIIEADDMESLIDIFKQNVAHKIYGLRNYQYELLKKIYHETKRREMSFILHVTSETGKVISAGLFIKSFDRLIYFFGASTPEGRENCSQILLLDHVINKFSSSPMQFDFEGGSIVGIDEFYSSFGARPLKICTLSQARIPSIFKPILAFRRRVVKSAIQYLKRS